eukprot:SAG22_NODE_19450_length_274_cov_247.148571_1_plen_62_part_10
MTSVPRWAAGGKHRGQPRAAAKCLFILKAAPLHLLDEWMSFHLALVEPHGDIPEVLLGLVLQ